MTTPQPQTIIYQQAAPSNKAATVSLVLGIVAICVGIIPLFIGLVLSLVPTFLAIIFGLAGLSRAGTTKTGLGAALTGLILGGVTFLLYFVGYGIIW